MHVRLCHYVWKYRVSFCLTWLLWSSCSVYAQIQPNIHRNTVSSFYTLAEQRQLSQQRAWLNIMHFHDGESEIDDTAFFFSSNGKYDPHAELIASITALVNDKTDTEDSVYCRYPSRSHWILEQIPEMRAALQLPQCTELQKELTQLNASEVTLILASAHLNSPASAFGHTFLRIDSPAHTPLAAYAVNYAAQTRETNGIIYAYQGLFGGYEGRYSIMTYSEKVKEYSDLEQRDIWEYTLNLSPEELQRLVYHIFEIRHFYADYFFASENCSYNLLWLLQVARPTVHLTTEFNTSVVPIDTVRAVKKAGFIQKETYRPASRKRMVVLAEQVHHPDSWTFIQSEEDYDERLLSNLSDADKINTLDLAVAQLKQVHSQQKISNAVYTKRLIKLLALRSQLGPDTQTKTETPPSPLTGHLSQRMTFGMEHQSQTKSENRMRLGVKAAYHDQYDYELGYLPGAFINFFDTQFLVSDETISLDRFSLIDIRSYAIQNALTSPISWQVQLGGRRLFENKMFAYLKTGAGMTIGDPDLYGYVMVSPAVNTHHQTVWSGAVESGVFFQKGQTKWGIKAGQEWFTSNRTEKNAEVMMTYQINQRWAWHVNYQWQQLTDAPAHQTLGVHLFYYY